MNKPLNWWRITNSNVLADIAVWLILLMPVVVYPFVYEPFGFGRYVIFMFALAGLLLGSLLAIGRVRLERRWWTHPLIWWLVIWWVIAVIAAFTGVNPGRSWWGTTIRAEGLFFVTGLIIFGLNLLVIARHEATWLKMFSIMTWVGAASGLYALLQPLNLPLMLPIGEGGRAFGLMGNPIFLGQLLLLTIFITLYFVYSSAGRWRWVYLASLLLQVLGIAVTVSRGPLIGLAAGALVWLIGWLLLRGRGKLRTCWPWVFGGVVAMAAVAAGLLYKFPDKWQRLLLTGDSIRARLEIWKTAWRAIQDRPWLGYGNENARYGLAHSYQSGLADISVGETTADRAHNLILDQLLTNGWIGLAVMVIIVGCLLWVLWRHFRASRRQHDVAKAILVWSLLSTLVAYLVSMMFVFDVVATSIYVTIIIAGIIFLVSPKLPEPVRISLGWPILSGALLIGLLFFSVRYLVPAWQIAVNVQSAIVSASRLNYRSANQFYAIAQGPLNPYRWPLLTSYPTFARKYALLVIDKEKDFNKANNIVFDGLRVLGNIQMNEPDRIGLFMEFPVLYTVLSYSDPNYVAKAKESFYGLTEQFPNHEYLYINGARSLMAVADYTGAKQLLDKATQFKSVPRELGFWRAIAMIKLKDKDQATIISDLKKSVTENIRFNDGDQDVLRLVSSHLVLTHQLDTAVYYQEKLVDLSPRDLTEQSNLLTLYKDLGRLDDVVRVARDIVTIHPSRWTEVQEFLRTIGRSL